MKRIVSLLLALFLLLTSAALAETAADPIVFHEDWDVKDNNRVFYEIFVGSFSDSDGDGTGDLRGIINRMSYLNDGDPASGQSLGVEGLWLTPIFASSSYHKYDVDDFYTIDPAFGTLEDLKELIDLCHKHNVILILDLPLNHTSAKNQWFRKFCNAHLTNNPDNAYYDFYTWLEPGAKIPAGRSFKKLTKPNLLVEANFSDSMPELNFDNEAVRQAVLDVAKFYMDLGVDGFRFDAAKYLYLGEHDKNVAFWSWYMDELKKISPDVYTVAEVWDGDGITNRYAGCFNCFHFSTAAADGLYAATAKSGAVTKLVSATQKYLDDLHAVNPEAMNVPFISNHDMDRASGYLPAAGGRMHMAAAMYLLTPGSPFIYYGEEIGLRGSRGGENTDANRRLAMLWGDGDTVKDPPGSTYSKQSPYSVLDLEEMDGTLLQHYRRLLQIRKANPEIARGAYTALSFPDTKAGGFLCEWDGSVVGVFHNPTTGTQVLDLTGVIDGSFTEITVAGLNEATLEGSVLTLGPQTTAVVR